MSPQQTPPAGAQFRLFIQRGQHRAVRVEKPEKYSLALRTTSEAQTT